MADKHTKHTFHTFVFIDSEYDDTHIFVNRTHDEITSKMGDFASEHFKDSNTPFKIVLVNLDTNVSTIYDYECEKIVKLSCTIY